MSTDTDLDPIEPWEDIADHELDELMRVVRVVGRMKEENPTFHAFMIGSIAAHVRGATRDLQALLTRHEKEAIRRDLMKLVAGHRARQG